jgi:hypothetical protein
MSWAFSSHSRTMHLGNVLIEIFTLHVIHISQQGVTIVQEVASSG